MRPRSSTPPIAARLVALNPNRCGTYHRLGASAGTLARAARITRIVRFMLVRAKLTVLGLGESPLAVTLWRRGPVDDPLRWTDPLGLAPRHHGRERARRGRAGRRARRRRVDGPRHRGRARRPHARRRLRVDRVRRRRVAPRSAASSWRWSSPRSRSTAPVLARRTRRSRPSVPYATAARRPRW